MPDSMHDVIKVIGPYLSPDLVPTEARQSIEHLARALPPLYWGGFELSLYEVERRVDFHQGLAAHGHAAAVAEAPITSMNPRYADQWKRIIRFCEEWADPGSALHDPVLKIGLEFDIHVTPADTAAPSVFWSFSDSEVGNQQGDQLLETIITSLEVLQEGPVPVELARNLRNFLDILPENAAVLHAGTMLSRLDRTLRINVWGLKPEQIVRCLGDCGWEDSTGEVEDTLLRLDGSVEAIVTGIDIGVDFIPRVGLECTPARADGGTPDWARLLEELISMEICTPVERNALLEWSGLCDPCSEGVEWPAGLIVESLLKEPHYISLIRRSLSHIKIDMRPGARPRAKAYLEFLPDWADLSSDPP